MKYIAFVYSDNLHKSAYILHFTTPLAFGHPPTLLEDEIGRLTDDLMDRLLLRLPYRALMATPFAISPCSVTPGTGDDST